jgi:hypothetical protein
MAKILTGIIVTVLVGLLFNIGTQGLNADDKLTIQIIPLDQFINIVCNGGLAPFFSFCNGYTSPTTTTTPSVITGDNGGSAHVSPTTTVAATSSSSGSPLQNAHWCQFSNGSYLALGQTFMYSQCSLCQCTQSHRIYCANLQCMSTYCIDNTIPSVRSGQCCSQCAYEQSSTSCLVNGIAFPHGTLLRKTSDNIQCWCQLGTVECRKVSTTLLSTLDYWGKGTAVYVIVIVICAIVLIGSILCLGAGIFFYYYYKQDQKATQEAYEQYYNSAGWQPMSEDGQVVDPNAEEKKAEAEQQQYEYEYATGNSEQYIPPPYALYNGPYGTAQEQKQI